MTRKVCLLLTTALLCSATVLAAAKPKEVADLAEAQADPDFAIQGEYLGDDTGAQVIALGGGKFDVVAYRGGLPGSGWKRGADQFKVQGHRDGNLTKLEGGKIENESISGKIVGGNMTLTVSNGMSKELKRIERKSAMLGAKPPGGAVVLFDGTSAAKFDLPDHLLPDKNLLSGVTTKDKFNNYTLHLEFRLSWMPEARGQGRSNSGVYIHDCYEIQVLDSFGLKGEDNECGGFYKMKVPDVNMCFPPMQWQTYDVDFTAPKYADGKKVANARITVRHNGMVIHDGIELADATPGRQREGPGPRPIHLQGHGNKVYYRNIWLVEKR